MSVPTPQRRLARFVLPLLAVAVVIGIVACENPVDDGPDAAPVGAVLLSGASQVAEYRVGAGASGELTVPRGEARTFRVRFVTASGRQLDVDGGDYSIRDPFVIVPNVASVSLLGADQLRITGQSAPPQPVTLRFEAFHGATSAFTAEVRLRVTP